MIWLHKICQLSQLTYLDQYFDLRFNRFKCRTELLSYLVWWNLQTAMCSMLKQCCAKKKELIVFNRFLEKKTAWCFNFSQWSRVQLNWKICNKQIIVLILYTVYWIMRVFTSCDRQPKPLTINKTEIDADSYFEMFMLYYCQLLIQKDKGDKICILTTI